MILIKVFVKRTIVSGEITLSAYPHARTHTHTGASTHEYTDYAQFRIQADLKLRKKMAGLLF